MSTLVVIAYEDIHKAEEVRIRLLKMQREYLVDLEDAVVVTKDASNKIKLNQIQNLSAFGALEGGFWGSLIGLLFLSPLLGMAAGATGGAIAGALADIGIDDNFMKEIAKSLKPNSSALFVLIRKITPDKVLAELEGTGGKVIKTSLSKADETKLQFVLDAVKQENISVKA